MLKIHSFLQEMKGNLKAGPKIIAVSACGIIAATLITGLERPYVSGVSLVRARETLNKSSIGEEIPEETEEVAQVRTELINSTSYPNTILFDDTELVNISEKVNYALANADVEQLLALESGRPLTLIDLKEDKVEMRMTELEKSIEEIQMAAEKAYQEKIEAERKAKIEEKKKKEALKEKKRILALKEAAAEVGLTYSERKVMKLSKQEQNALERIVEAESGCEDIYGRMLVAGVVLNRYESKRFPNTIEQVVTQRAGNRYQFSPVRPGGSYWKVTVSKTTKEAVSRVLNGEDYTQGALYFAARQAANKKNMNWFDRCLTRLFQYGGHEFFKN